MAAAPHGGSQYWRLFRDETGWYNEMVLSVVVPGDWWRGLPHLVQSWLRNCVGVYLMYFIIGFLWCFVIYYWKQHAYVPKGRPSLHLLICSSIVQWEFYLCDS
jgi:lathosterol oxidase